ncbi:MAG: AMP-binding protein [Bacillales bacterium]|nr:AMP-binding protein [Bacillales bacterium]
MEKHSVWDLEQFNNKCAAMDEYGNVITYRELANCANDLKKCIGSRKLVFLVASNTLSSLKAYVACLNSGNVPVMLSEELDKQQFGSLYETYGPQYVYTRKTEIVTKEMQRISVEEKKQSNDGYEWYHVENTESYSLFEELALLLTTSGSTGSPKLVRQSYKNIKANMISIVEYLKLDCNERPITTLPMNYTYGLSIINSHLAVGATILLTEKSLMQREFWEFFKANEATSFGGVPYTYEMLKKLRIFRMDLPSLKTMTQAGGKLLPALHKEFAEYAKETGREFVVMYGQTEATARMAYLPPEKSLEKYGSMGVAIPGGTFTLIDADGKEILESDIVGELVYEGENVTLGYAEVGNDLSKGDENLGKLQTGDMAKRDEDGYYYIVGRKKRFLKIYGKRINLDEVGTLVKDRFNQIECASAGKDDELYVFITDEDYRTEVREFVKEKMHISSNAIKVVVVNEIPKNDSGKVMYVNLEKYYA